MYQALYRKHRPTTFEDVAGQKVVVTTLKNALKNNKISHAYIFSGPRGTGKTSVAKLLAKAVNCTGENGPICNNCVNCTQILGKQSSDIIEIDAASNNGVDEIREIRNNVNLVPTNGKYKIYIVDEVHMLTTGAFNALLKTLEEPPSHAIFILATTEPHKIPATISSRCQKFEFKKISEVDMKTKLKCIIDAENIKIEEAAINEIIRTSDGGLRDCISLLDQVCSYSDNIVSIDEVHEINGTLNNKKIFSFIDNIFSKNIALVFNEINDYYQSGKNIVKVTEELLIILRNILINKIDQNLVNDDYYKKYDKINKKDIINLLTLLNNDFNNYKNSNDPKLCLEISLIRFIDNMENSYEFSENDDYKDSSKIFEEKLYKKEVDKNLEIEINNEVKNDDEDNEVKNDNEVCKEDKTAFKEENPVICEDNYENTNEYNNEKQNITESIAIEEEMVNVQEINNIFNMIEKLKDIRINNTLSKFNKAYFMNVKSRMELFEKYKNDPDFSFVADMLTDAELKAASDEYLIFVCITQLQSEMFNKNLTKIEELIFKVFNKNFKVISTELESWNVIKLDFNEKKRIFEYIEENNDILKDINIENNKERNELDEIYGSLVQYEEEK